MAQYIQLPQVNVPNAYTGPGNVTLPYAEGWSATAGPNPFLNPNSSFPKLPDLPGLGDLPSIGDILSGVPKMSDIAGADNPVASAAWWLTGRYITVFLGLLFLAAGLYLFGTSQVADALKRSVA